MSGATLLIDFLAFWRGGAKQPRQLKICPDVEGLDRGLQNKRSKTTLFAQSTRSFWQAVSQQSIVFHNIRNMCHEEGESFSIHIGFRKHGGRIAEREEHICDGEEAGAEANIPLPCKYLTIVDDVPLAETAHLKSKWLLAPSCMSSLAKVKAFHGDSSQSG